MDSQPPGDWRGGPEIAESSTRDYRERQRLKERLKRQPNFNFDKRFGQDAFKNRAKFDVKHRPFRVRWPKVWAFSWLAVGAVCLTSRFWYGWMFEMDRPPTQKELDLQLRIDERYKDWTFLGFKLHHPPEWSPIWEKERLKKEQEEQQRALNAKNNITEPLIPPQKS